jgi:hypothetical protein
MLSNNFKKLMFDYFILFGALLVSSLFIKKLVKDISLLILNIGFWLFLIIGLGLITYDKYLAFIIEILIGLVLFISFFVYKSKNLTLNDLPMANNISTELKADPNSFYIIFGVLVVITVLTILCFFFIKKFNFKIKHSDPERGIEGEIGKEGERGIESVVLNKPNNIVYENLRVMANDYFIKRKKEIMTTWDYNNRKLYYKNELPSVFNFNERERQLRNISFYENLKRICDSKQFNIVLKQEADKLFKEQKQSVEFSLDEDLDFEYRSNIEYGALKVLLDKLEPSIYSAIDQICPNDLEDDDFLGIKFLNKDIDYNPTFYKLIKKDSLAYKDHIWDWGKKDCN